jgi:hypothetical protein
MGAAAAHKVDVYYKGQLLMLRNLAINKGRITTFG